MNNIRIVKIKTWEQMEQEFGLNLFNNIKTQFTFTIQMEKKLPKNRVIILDKNSRWNGYDISKTIIEEELDPKDYPEYLI